MSTKVYCIGDAHNSPKIKKDRFDWIGKDIRKESPDVLWCAGDFDSLDSVGLHEPDDSYLGRAKPLLQSELRASREAQERLDTNSRFRGDKRLTRGNHEYRLIRFSNDHPAVYGLLTGEYDSALKEFGWRLYEYGEVTQIAGVGFTHVPFTIMGKPYGGKTADYRIAADAGTDIVYGHSHRAGVVRSPRIGGGHVSAINVGCSLPWGHVEPYAKHATTGWWWGTLVLEINKGKITDWNFKSMRALKDAYG